MPSTVESILAIPLATFVFLPLTTAGLQFCCAAKLTDQKVEWDRASAFGLVDLGFDSKSGQTNDLQIGSHSFPVSRSALKGTVWRTNRQVYLLCRSEGHFITRFPHPSVVNKWPATPSFFDRFLVL